MDYIMVEQFIQEEFNLILAAGTEIEGLDMVREYPSRVKSNPLRQPVISVGYNSFEINLLPDSSGTRVARFRIAMTIHAPIGSSGEACHDLFLRLTNYIQARSTSVVSFGCDAARYDRNTAAIVLNAWNNYEILF